MKEPGIPQSTSQKSGFSYGYIVVAASFLIIMVTYGAVFSFGVFFKPLLAEFGWTRGMTSLAFSLAVFMHGFFYVIMGRLNDRFGPRIVLTVCGFSLGLGFLLVSQITTLWQIYLFYGLVIALGISGYVPLVSTVAKWFSRTRGMMTGIVLLGAGVGTMAMPPLAEGLNSTYGWRMSYVIIGVVAWVIMVSAAQFLRHSPAKLSNHPPGSNNAQESNRSQAAHGVSLQQVVRMEQFWLLLGLLACQRFIIQAIMVHIVPHVIDLGISAITAASMLTIIGGVSLAGRIMMGSLGDRIGTKPSFAICFILMSGALLLLLAAKELWLFYLFAAIFGFTYGGMYTLGSPMTAELFGLGSHGLIFGAVSFGGTIGGAFGPVLAGHIFDVGGSYQPAFLIFVVISLIGLAFTWLIRPTSTKIPC